MSAHQNSLSSIASATALSIPTTLPAPDRGEPTRKPAQRPSLRAGGRPRAIVPRTLDEAMAFARAVVAARMAPSGFETPEACMIAILHGMEVGLTPLSALQRIAVIGGRPTIWGDGAMALVRASGLAASIEERIEGTGPTDWVGVCTVRRKGEAQPVERRFSSEDARRARLWGKAGPWSDYPQRMLQMRARAFALRDVFADVLGGLYLREEIEGEEEAVAWTEAAGANGAVNPTASVDVPSGDSGASEAVTPAVSQPSPAKPYRSAPPRRKIIAPPPPPAPPSPIEPAVKPAHLAANAPEPRQADAPEQAVETTTARRPAPDPVRPRAALAERRRLSSTREALRMRFESGWAIRRPRTLAARPAVTRQGGPLPARPAPQDVAPQPLPPQAAETGSAQEETASTSPHDVLTLYDDALSCALDEPTLGEIVGEFGPRLATLDRDAAAQAERITSRHRDRVAALAMLEILHAIDADAGGQP
jgi:hypothetical protein